MSVILIKVIQFFVSLSLLVMIHEFGHYIAARIFKIRVEKFYIFFNPWFTLYKKKIGETEYGVGWLPLGGYVSLAGMIDESMNTEQMKLPPQPWEFRTKPAWQRLIVMVAGVFMNVVLAMIIYSGMLFTWGESYLHNDSAVHGYAFSDAGKELGFKDRDRILSIDGEKIGDAQEIGYNLLIADEDRTVELVRDRDTIRMDIPLSKLVAMRESGNYKGMYSPIVSPLIVEKPTFDSAVEAGYQRGDQIVAVGDKRLYSGELIRTELMEHKGKSVDITVLRYQADSLGKMATTEVVIPTAIDGEGRIGVELQSVEDVKPTHKEYGFFESIPAGIKMAGQEIASYWEQLKMIVNPDTKLYKEVGGFLSIGGVFPDTWDWYSFWRITALISIMLAVMNLLPIPGLDGGHALFTLWELITRRKPSDKFMEIMQWIGLFILFALLIYANGNDIIKLFS